MAQRDSAKYGWVKGQARDFVKGHGSRAKKQSEVRVRQEGVDPATWGLCECGCGGKTTVPEVTVRSMNRVAGVPMRFIAGHHSRRPAGRLLEYPNDYYSKQDDGCWIWLRCRNSGGYGRVTIAGRSQAAYRAIYEMVNGSVPKGLHLDHLCGNPPCVNPDHLEPVTPRENIKRSVVRSNEKTIEERLQDVQRARDKYSHLAVDFDWAVDDISGCWVWLGSIATNGYGRIHCAGTSFRAHRVVYEAVRGVFLGGQVLDHLCRLKICVNPDHLEPVTARENVRRRWRHRKGVI